MKAFRHIFVISLFLLGLQTHAQKYFGLSGETFGNSKIQKKNFFWKTIKTNNFEFNFYKGGEEIARRAAIKAETDYSKITETLGYTPFSVMKVFIYNNPDDILQSNIGEDSKNENNKSVDLAKARIQVVYNKSDSLFNKELISQISTLFVYDMLYGGSLKESVQSQLLLSVPDWYVNGISAYIASSSVSPNKEKVVELLQKYSNKKVGNIMGEDAELLGHSIWFYIAQRYGKDNISNILNLTRIIRNEQSSITSTLGLSFNKFIKEWRGYYLKGDKQVETQVISRIEPEKADPNASSKLDLKPNEIDTDFYEFSIENIEKYTAQKAFVAKSLNPDLPNSPQTRQNIPGQEIKLSPVKAYNNLLVANGSVAGLRIDPVRRFGLGYAVTFNDLLENNILKVDAFLKVTSPFFKNYDYTLSYGRYASKIDYLFKFEKRSINIEGIDESNSFLFRPLNIVPLDNKSILISRRLLYQKISADIIYPFSKNLKVDFSPAYIKASDIEYELPGRDILTDSYLSPSINIVFDNTNIKSFKIEVGTKAKFSIERNMNFSNQKKNFQRLNIDVRHTQRLAKGIFAEGRFNLTRSAGNAPKFSILGGVENWVNRALYDVKTQIPGKEGDFSDILFYNFPGNLRGFQTARLFGHSHSLINAEIKLVMAEYFPASSLTNSFLRNLQVVGFVDSGTAWNGNKGPFSKQNSLNTIVIGNDGKSPFFAEVTNFKNPFLTGMGLGLRTSILGYLVKADYAVGKEDKTFSKPILHISLGKDF
jgi:hypothetical protein